MAPKAMASRIAAKASGLPVLGSISVVRSALHRRLRAVEALSLGVATLALLAVFSGVFLFSLDDIQMGGKNPTIALTKANLNVPPPAAVTNVKPSRPAPLREDAPPAPAPAPAQIGRAHV